MRVGFVEGVLAVMVFRFMFNVCSLVLICFDVFLGLFLGHFRSKCSCLPC